LSAAYYSALLGCATKNRYTDRIFDPNTLKWTDTAMPLLFSSARLPLLFLLFCSVSMFVGCQRPPKAIEASFTPYNASTFKKLSQLSHFRVSGKVGFRQGETGGQAQFVWNQTGQPFTLQLLNPFGGEEARLSFSAGEYRLKMPREPWEVSHSIESLFEEKMGWSAPVAHLAYWIKGIPVPNVPSTVSHNKAGMRIIKQAHWTITYLSAIRVDGLLLPASMVLERSDLPAGPTRLKMILRWSL
jgi:outer membrane lipoprotein LolB